MQLEAGYQLIRISDGAVIKSWGGVPGQSPSVPGIIDVPSVYTVTLEPDEEGNVATEERAGFDYVYCPQLETDYSGYKLSVWMMNKPTITTFDGATFLGRVTDDEYGKILRASQTNVQLARWLDIFRLRGEIDVTGNTSIAAKAGLVAMGLLTQERADIIFATA